MRYLRFSLLLMLCLSLCIGFSSTSQDNTEEVDATILTLPILEAGVPIETAFDSDLDAQLFVFNATEGDLVTITMSQLDETVDPYIVLIGASGQVYGSNDDGLGNGSLDSRIADFEIPETGSYFIMATTYAGIRDATISAEDTVEVEGLNYSMLVEGNTPAEDLALPFEYFAGQVEIGEVATFEISRENPIFFVTFEAEKGETISLGARGLDGNADNYPDVDTLLYVFDFTGNRLAADDDGGEETLSSLVANFEVPQTGLYFVFAAAYNYYDAVNPEVGEDDWDSEGEIEFSVQ